LHHISEAFQVAADFIESRPFGSSHRTYLTVKNHTASELGRQLTLIDKEAIQEAMQPKYVLEKRGGESGDGHLAKPSSLPLPSRLPPHNLLLPSLDLLPYLNTTPARCPWDLLVWGAQSKDPSSSISTETAGSWELAMPAIPRCLCATEEEYVCFRLPPAALLSRLCPLYR
jgi:hypothetical protein